MAEIANKVSNSNEIIDVVIHTPTRTAQIAVKRYKGEEDESITQSVMYCVKSLAKGQIQNVQISHVDGYLVTYTIHFVTA